MEEKKYPTLKELRESKGVTQSVLAKHSTVNLTRICRIERGEVEPSFVERLDLSLALGEPYSHIEWPTVRRKRSLFQESKLTARQPTGPGRGGSKGGRLI